MFKPNSIWVSRRLMSSGAWVLELQKRLDVSQARSGLYSSLATPSYAPGDSLHLTCHIPLRGLGSAGSIMQVHGFRTKSSTLCGSGVLLSVCCFRAEPYFLKSSNALKPKTCPLSEPQGERQASEFKTQKKPGHKESKIRDAEIRQSVLHPKPSKSHVTQPDAKTLLSHHFP